jgi:hypothetical protein
MDRRRKIISVVAIVAIVFASVAVLPRLAAAKGNPTTYYVAGDGNDNNSCLDSADACQHISYILDHVSGNNDLTINVAPATQGTSVLDHVTIPSGRTGINIVDEAPANGPAVIDGIGGIGSVFTIASGASVTLQGLTIEDGIGGSSSNPYNAWAGGVTNNGTVTLIQDLISSNTYTTGTATAAGIVNTGTLTMSQSTVTDDTGTDQYGAIFSYSPLAAQWGSASMTLTNDTISRNFGGYSTVYVFRGPASLTNVTIAGDIPNVSGAEVVSDGSVISLAGTIISSTATDCGIYDMGRFDDGGYNILSDGSCGFSASESGVNPDLLPLGNYGGPTETSPPQNQSPAVDQIPVGGPGCPGVDQTGAARPRGIACDIGAVEIAPSQTVTFTTNNPSPEGVGQSYTPKATGGRSTSPVIISLDVSSTGCILYLGVVYFYALGTCVVDANQAGDALYPPAVQVTQSIIVERGTPTLTISNLPASGNEGGSFTAVVSTNGDGTTSVTSSTPTVCSVSGLVVTFVGVGTCSLTSHVTAGTNYTAADGSAQSFTVNSSASITTLFSSATPGTYAVAVPAGVTSVTSLVVGGTGGTQTEGGNAGGKGGVERATSPVIPGATLTVTIGANGGTDIPGGTGGMGGRGAGNGGSSVGNPTYIGTYAGGGGAGGSAVFEGSTPLVVGGGGGGGSASAGSGAGGNADQSGSNGETYGGGAGTLTGPGAGSSAGTPSGSPGSGMNGGAAPFGGGGGGGYFGGGGGFLGGGGGGSSYPSAATAWDSTATPSVRITYSTLSIPTSSIPPAAPSTPYGPVTLQAANVEASTSPYTTTLKWKKVSLPKGLKLSSTGVLSGTPNAKLAAGPNSVTVQVTETVTTLNGKKKVKTKTTVQATIPLTIT